MTAVKRFCWKRVAVYPLHSFVLGVRALDNYTVQNDPCVMLILEPPKKVLMSEGPDKIICIIRIISIIVNIILMNFRYIRRHDYSFLED